MQYSGRLWMRETETSSRSRYHELSDGSLHFAWWPSGERWRFQKEVIAPAGGLCACCRNQPTNNNNQQPTTNNQQPTTTNNQQPTTTNNNQQATTNNQQPTTTNNQQQPTTTTNNNQQQQRGGLHRPFITIINTSLMHLNTAIIPITTALRPAVL